MTTQEVANRLVSLCREGKHEQVVKELYAPDIVSIEPEGAPNRIAKGLEAIIAKGEQFDSRIEKVNTSFISDPVVADNFFSCSMLMNVNMKGVPVPVDMNEVCLYTVNEGKIVQEQFFYTPQPQEA
ncbi:MAG: nuclear transport factor 2 family protein [Saprospiraceae bacterium]|nr:nuclear transport factor 2 family protein [Saprospiraceae bacterium]